LPLTSRIKKNWSPGCGYQVQIRKGYLTGTKKPPLTGGFFVPVFAVYSLP
jgi:hypothetical protein